MFDIGTQELIIIFIVALLVFGPKKLPELARTLGKGMRELKAAMRGVKDSIDDVETEVTKDLKKDIKENILSGDLFDIQDNSAEKKDSENSAGHEKEGDVEEEKKEKVETENDG